MLYSIRPNIVPEKWGDGKIVIGVKITDKALLPFGKDSLLMK